MTSGVYKRTETHKANIGKALKGRTNTWMLGEKNMAKRPEVRKKISEKLTGRKPTSSAFKKGKNHINWKGGITPERTTIWYSKEYKVMKKCMKINI